MPLVPNTLTLAELETLLTAIKQEIAVREASAAPPPEFRPDPTASQAQGASAAPKAPASRSRQAQAGANPPRSTARSRPHPLETTPPAPPLEPHAVAAPIMPPGQTAEPVPPSTSGAGNPAPPPAADAAPAAIRYVHPASRALTWSGEGDTPDWVTAYLANGGSWSAMENAAELLARSHRRAGALASVREASRKSKQ